jgi:hypothetical protein
MSTPVPKPAKVSAKIIAFFNTPLGLWFLSTVAIGVITWGYALVQSNLAEQREVRTRTEHLDTEIFERIRAYDVLLRSMMEAEDKEHYKLIGSASERDVSELLSLMFRRPGTLKLSNGREVTISGTYPEFEARSTVGLLIELKNRMSDKDVADRIGRVIDHFEYDYVVTIRGVQSLAKLYQDRQFYFLPRWGYLSRPTR